MGGGECLGANFLMHWNGYYALVKLNCLLERLGLSVNYNLVKNNSSKVLQDNKITIKADVAIKLNIKMGERVIFEDDEKGKICIKKG